MFNRHLYTVIFNLLIPLFLLNLLLRSRKNPAYRKRVAERFAYVHARQGTGRCLWLHAVSVGEVIAARPLIERLLCDYPEDTVWVTTTTPTGSDTVKRLFAGRVAHSYCPYDLPGSWARFMQRVRPDLLLVVETEIWPNLYQACADRNIPVLLVNARLSERSCRGYARFGRLVRSTLAHVGWLGARSQQDAAYFLQLGARPETVEVCGNLKFDLQIPPSLSVQAQALRQQWGSRPVWVAGSTHAGEDEIILRVFQQLRQQLADLLLILVPRHPERFESVYQLCTATGLASVRRSTGQPVTASTAILLGDSMGELLLWYAAADVAFMGGSLVPRGGHNPLEAAAFAVPVISGVHTANFTDMFPPLYATGGAVQASDAEELYALVLHWFQDDAARHLAGQQAQAFFTRQQGALALIMRNVHTRLA